MLIHDYLINSAKRFPDKEAIIAGDRKASYGDILRDSYNVASWLIENDLKVGDRVAILLDEPVEYVKSYFGIMLAGGVVVAMNTQPSVKGLRYQLNNCQVSFLLTQQKFMSFIKELSGQVQSLVKIAIHGCNDNSLAEIPFSAIELDDVLSGTNCGVAKLPKCSSDHLAQIIYTSGTTGEPNGVMLSHSNLVANTNSIVEYLNLTSDDRVMAVLPFFYSYGNSLLLTHFAVGGSLVVNQHFLYPNVILDEMVKEEVTGFSGVPSTFAILLNRSSFRDYKFPKLRYVTQAGGAMSPKLAHQIKEIVPDTDVYIMYGQTEASARLSYLEPKELFTKAGSIGRAIPGVTLNLFGSDGKDVGIGEIGEIVAQGKNIMAGYWESPEKTEQVLREDGLWTGDLAKKDEEGFLYIVSRKSEMIKSGAHRISPKEIEEVILENSSVHEVAVIGLDDEILGESIKACIVLKEDAECKERDMIKHCRRLLPQYKVPHKIEFISELPKTVSGKVRKKELKAG